MSIIDIKSRTTTSARTFQDSKSSDRSVAWVDEGTNVERFSVELSIGEAWSRRYGPASNEMLAIPDEGIKLGANQSVVVEVAERIAVPHNMYGLVIPTGSLFLNLGIILAAAKIEPSFNDRLKLRLVNTSGESRVVKRGQKVASAIFHSTETTEFSAEFHKKSVTATRAPGRIRTLSSWMKRNPVQLTTWFITFVTSSVSAALLVAFVFPALVPVKPAVRADARATDAAKPGALGAGAR